MIDDPSQSSPTSPVLLDQLDRLRAVWDQIRAIVAPQSEAGDNSGASTAAKFNRLALLSFDGAGLVLGVSNKVLINGIQKHDVPKIRSAIRQVLGLEVAIRVEFSATAPDSGPAKSATVDTGGATGPQGPSLGDPEVAARLNAAAAVDTAAEAQAAALKRALDRYLADPPYGMYPMFLTDCTPRHRRPYVRRDAADNVIIRKGADGQPFVYAPRVNGWYTLDIEDGTGDEGESLGPPCGMMFRRWMFWWTTQLMLRQDKGQGGLTTVIPSSPAQLFAQMGFGGNNWGGLKKPPKDKPVSKGQRRVLDLYAVLKATYTLSWTPPADEDWSTSLKIQDGIRLWEPMENGRLWESSVTASREFYTLLTDPASLGIPAQLGGAMPVPRDLLCDPAVGRSPAAFDMLNLILARLFAQNKLRSGQPAYLPIHLVHRQIGTALDPVLHASRGRKLIRDASTAAQKAYQNWPMHAPCPVEGATFPSAGRRLSLDVNKVWKNDACVALYPKSTDYLIAPSEPASPAERKQIIEKMTMPKGTFARAMILTDGKATEAVKLWHDQRVRRKDWDTIRDLERHFIGFVRGLDG